MNKKLTREYVRGEFTSEGYVLAEDWKYVSSLLHIPFICNRGHESSIRWNSWKSGSRCKYCSYNIPSSEYVRGEFGKEGYVIAEDWEYVNAKTKIPYVCSDGHEYSVVWYSFKIGNRCGICSGKSPHSEEYMRESFLKERYKIPEDWKYVNNQTKIPYTCNNGHEHSISWHHWNRGNRCRYCSIAKGNLKKYGHRKLYVYWIKIYDWIHGKWCYKFGITGDKNIEGRFNKASKKWGFKFEILERTEASKEQICLMEVDLLYHVRNYRAEWVPPEFGGSTECFVCSEAFARYVWNKVTLGW